MRVQYEILIIRLLLTLAIYILAILLFDRVWDVVGYMYRIYIQFSLGLAIYGFLLAAIVVASTNFASVIYRHAFDSMLVGIYLPVAVMSSFRDVDGKYMTYTSITLLIASFGVWVFSRSSAFNLLLSDSQLRMLFQKTYKNIKGIFIITILYFIVVYRGDFSLNIFDVYYQTYSIRAERSVDGLGGYLIGWFTVLFYPFLLSDGFETKNKPTLFAAFFSAYFLFQVFAIKVIFFSFILWWIMGYAQARKLPGYRYTPHLFYLFILAFVPFTSEDYCMLVDRFFYLIGTNCLFYFDFFSIHPLRFFEGTKLGILGKVYGVEPGYLIDLFYYQGYGTNQSAGFVPTMFANVGWIGLWVSAVILAALIVTLHSFSVGSFLLSYLLTVAVSFTLINASLNMLLLSDGLILVVMVFFYLKHKSSPVLK